MKVQVVLAGLSVLLAFARAENEDKTCSWHKTDIVIFVDLKSNTGSSVFRGTVKPFLRSFVTTLKRQLKLPRHKGHLIRVAVVTFGGQLVVHHCLADDQSAGAILGSIQSMRFASGSMSMVQAFDKCDNAHCFDAGIRDLQYKSEKTIIIMVTDADGDKEAGVKAAAQVFKDKNYSIFGIGIGIEERETTILEALAVEPYSTHVFNIRDRCTFDKFAIMLLKYVRLDQCAIQEVSRTMTVSVTEKPIVTEIQVTEEPMLVTEEAVQVTEEAVQVTEEVVQVTEEPIQVTEEPIQVTEETIQVTEEPIQVTEETIQVTEETVQVTEEATQVTEETTEVTEEEPDSKANQATFVTNVPPKIIAVDIAFIIDSSMSLLPEQFEEEKRFAIEVMQQIPIGPEAARFAALTFANDVDVHFRFDDTATALDILKQLKKIPFKAEGATFTDKAINIARTDIFGDGYSIRNSEIKSAKIAIVITDGAPSKKKALALEADLARAEGIQILAVGIGANFNKNRELLMPMVGNRPEYIFVAKEFSELNAKVGEIMDQLRTEN